MAWGGTLTNLTNVAGELILDEGSSFGTHTTDALDLDAKNGGGVCWRRIEVRVVVEENPAATGEPTYDVDINVNAGGWSGWKQYQEGEYYCDEINIRTTVYGDPAVGQRPKITFMDIDGPPANAEPKQHHIISAVGALPGAPTYGDRHYLNTDDTINTCTDPQTPAWRKLPVHAGMKWYDQNTSQEDGFDGTEPVCWDPRRLGNGHITILGWSISATGAGGWTPVANATQVMTCGFYDNWTGGGQADLDEVDYQLTLSMGTYTIALFTREGPGQAIIDIDLDPGGAPVEVASFDCYAAGAAVNIKKSDAGNAITQAGLYTLTARVDGRNGLANDWKADLGAIILFRTA